MQEILDILNYKLIDGEKIKFTLLNLIFLVGIIVITTFVLKFVRSIVTRKLPLEDKNKFISVFQFIKYLVYVFAIMFTLDASGVDMKIFLTASAVYLLDLDLRFKPFS
jgi:small-conductance mechanosensitive channel